MKKILSFVLSYDFEITPEVVRLINSFIAINIPYKHLDKVSIIFDPQEKQSKAAVVGEIIASITRIQRSEVIEAKGFVIKKISAVDLCYAFESLIIEELGKSDTRFIIVVYKTNIILTPFKMCAEMSDFKIGKPFKFKQISAYEVKSNPS